MIAIRKAAGPRSLARYRATPNASYNGMSTDYKNDIRQRLLDEQGYICAYCMRRISLENTQIEHYLPRRPDGVHQDTDLLYSNMLGVCQGNKGSPPKNQTCDTHRGNKPLTVNPVEKHTIDTIAYKPNGQIYSANPAINIDLQCTLNLNFSGLCDLRMQTLNSLKRELIKRKSDGSWEKIARSYRDKLVAKAVKDEYVGILIWYLNQKLR